MPSKNASLLSDISYRWIVLGMIFLSKTMVVGIIWYAIPALAPTISATLEMSISKVLLLLYSVANFVIMIGTIPAGVLGDRYSHRLIVATGIFVAGFGTILLGRAMSLNVLLLASGIIGLGIALVYPNYIDIVTKWFPPSELNIGQAVNNAAYAIGTALAGSLSAGILLMTLGSWRMVLLVYGVVAIFLGILWIVLVRKPTVRGNHPSKNELGTESQEESVRETLRALLTHTDTYSAVFIAICAYYIGVGSLALIPTWAQRMTFAVPEIVIGLPGYFIAIGGLLFVPISDRIGRKLVLYITLVGVVIGVLIAGYAVTFVMFIAGLVLLGLTNGGLLTMIFTLPGAMPAIDSHRSGTMTGFLLSVGLLGGTVAPYLISRVLEAAGLGPSVAVTALPALTGLLAIWHLNLEMV